MSENISADAPKPCHVCNSTGKHEEWCSVPNAPKSKVRSPEELERELKVVERFILQLDHPGAGGYRQGYKKALEFALGIDSRVAITMKGVEDEPNKCE